LNKAAKHLSFLSAVVSVSLILSGCSTTKPATDEVTDLKSLTPSKTGTLDFLDSVNAVSDLTHGTATVPKADKLTVVGWAVDNISKSAAKSVYLEFDGKIYRTKYGTPRPDVAAAFNEQAFVNSGFTADLPVPSGDGPHTIVSKIVSSAGNTYYEGKSATFVVH
jgi:hypothetical protein